MLVFMLIIGLAFLQSGVFVAGGINASAPTLNLSSPHYTTFAQAVAACAVCSKISMSVNATYGLVPSQTAGAILYYPYKVGSTYYVYNVLISQKPSYINISVNSSLFNITINSAGHHYLPSLLPQGETINVTVTLSSSLIGGQQMPYNITISGGGNIYYQNSNLVSNAISIVNTFQWTVGTPFDVQIDGLGNKNYTLEDPSLTSTPATFTLSNTIIDVGQYTYANAFLSGGTGTYIGNWSWIQTSAPGNYITANGFNKFLASANSLVGSPTNGDENTCSAYNGYIYCAGVGNANGNSVEVAQIYAGTNTVGKWALSANVITTAAGTGVAFASCFVYNGYDWCFGDNNNDATIYSAPVYSGSNVVGKWTQSANTLFGAWTDMSCNPWNGYVYCVGGFDGVSEHTTTQVARIFTNNVIGAFTSTNALGQLNSDQQCTINNGYIFCIGGANSNTLSAQIFSTNPKAISKWTQTSNTIAPFGATSAEPCGSWQNYIYCLQFPPAGTATTMNVLISQYYGGNVIGKWFKSANSIPVSVMEGGGTFYNNYFYSLGGASSTTVYVANLLTTGVIYNQPLDTVNNAINLLINPTSNTAMTMTYSGNSLTATSYLSNTLVGIWTFNAFIQDGTAVNSIYLTNTLTINPAMSTPTITANVPFPSTQAVGNVIAVNAFEIGGSTPYASYNFLVYNSVTNIQVGNFLTTSNNFAYTIPASQAGNTLVFNVIVTDGATTNAIINSILTGVITVPTGYTAPTVTISSPTNTIVDVGQYQSLTATISGGTPNYAYNFNVFNSLAINQFANAIIFTSVSSNTQLVTYFVGRNELPFGKISNSIAANVMITDSKPTTVNSIPSSAYTVYNTLTAGNTIPNLPIVDGGQIITLTSNPSGGATPYIRYQWFSNTIAAPLCDSANAIGGATSSTYLAVPLTSTYYAYNVVDSATTSATSCSNGDKVNENPAIVITIAISNTVVDAGQSYETFSAYVTGGTSPFTYNFLVYNSITNVLISNQITTSNTYTFLVPSYWTTNNLFYANVFVTDSATTPVISNSLLSSKVTVNQAMSTPIIVGTNSYALDSGQYITFNAFEGLGTSPYTYNFLVYNSITNLLVGNFLGSTNSFSLQVFSVNTIYSNVFVTDNLGFKVNSILTGVFNVNSLQVAGLLTESNTIITSGAYSRLTAGATALGTPPYTINWFSQVNCGGSSIGSGQTLLVNPTSTTSYSFNTVDSAITLTSSCSAANSISVNGQPAIVLSPGSNSIDVGTTVFFSNTVMGGTPPYSFAFIVNSMTGVTIGSNKITFGSSGVFDVSESVTDLFGFSGNSNNAIITVNSVPLAGPITPSSPTIDVGGSVTLNSNPSRGTPPYTYQWYMGTQCGTQIGGATSSTYSASPSVTTSYSYTITDSAYVPFSSCSQLNTVFVNALPAWGAFTATNPIKDGQTQQIIATFTGGTAPFTYNFLIYNPGGALTYNLLVSSSSQTYTTSYTQTLPAGLWTANIAITDTFGNGITNSLTYQNYEDFVCNFAQSNSVVFLQNTLYYNDPLQSNTLLLYETPNTVVVQSRTYNNLTSQAQIPPGNFFQISSNTVIYQEGCVAVSNGSSTTGTRLQLIFVFTLICAIGVFVMVISPEDPQRRDANGRRERISSLKDIVTVRKLGMYIFLVFFLLLTLQINVDFSSVSPDTGTGAILEMIATALLVIALLNDIISILIYLSYMVNRSR